MAVEVKGIKLLSSKTNNLFSKVKPRFVTRQEGDGDENEVEVRADEEQSLKLQEIIDLLLAAGYFRARIKGLSSFDKVVGGMTWCIEFCNVEVDVDILFQENSTIGQKIALTEKIVAVLPKLQCPHQIEPHQIQGLDFIHIFPVVQWLVKRSMEFRIDTADFVYSYALNQFAKEFPQPQERSGQKQQLKNVKVVHDIYKPFRAYRRKNVFPLNDVRSKIQVTLLEYDYDNLAKHSKEIKHAGTDQHFEQPDIQQIMNNMALADKEFDYDNLTEEDREKSLNHYKTLNKEFKFSGYKSVGDQQHSNLKEKSKEIMSRLNKLEDQKNFVEEEIEKMNEIIQNVRLKHEEIDQTLTKLELNGISSEKTEEVEKFVILSDNLKKQEIEFRENCKHKLLELQNSTEEAKRSKSELSEGRSKEIERQLIELNEKLKIVRFQVAKQSRVISALQRRIDDVPNRAELAQYQRRFIELYNQISAKHKETKQYYSLYNTLEDTRLYMKKELSLLNSISDSYPQAMLSREGREEFLQQLMDIFEGVQQSKLKLEKRLSEEKLKRDELSKSLHNLVELNRKYVAAIKQLKLECYKNEALLAKLKSNN